jgi:hypothetical protein
MPKPLFDWIAAALTMSYVRKNGAIITADFNRAEQSRLEFKNALITEIGIPACDALRRIPDQPLSPQAALPHGDSPFSESPSSCSTSLIKHAKDIGEVIGPDAQCGTLRDRLPASVFKKRPQGLSLLRHDDPM